MFLIFILRIFIQEDRKRSIQERISNIFNQNTSYPLNSALKHEYLDLVFLTQKVKFKQPLSISDTLFLAKNYKSLKNELNGESVRHYF